MEPQEGIRHHAHEGAVAGLVRAPSDGRGGGARAPEDRRTIGGAAAIALGILEVRPRDVLRLPANLERTGVVARAVRLAGLRDPLIHVPKAALLALMVACASPRLNGPNQRRGPLEVTL